MTERAKRVRDCIKSGDHHKLDPSIDNGKWFAAKVLKESSDLEESSNFTSPPLTPSPGRRSFLCKIPSLFTMDTCIFTRRNLFD